MARALLPSLSDGRPPMDMLTTSTPFDLTAKIMPSIRAALVQPATNRQARTETMWAPGAMPLIWPPNRALPAAMPATCEPWAPETMPMLTNRSFLLTWTTKGIRSATGVAGLSVPK